MADKSLSWIPFLLGRTTSDDAGRTNPDPIGFFYCRLSTARFLDIVNKQFTGYLEAKRKSYTRSKSLADGTNLETSKENSDGLVAESTVKIAPKRKPGGQTIRLVTGKKDAGKKTYKQISFNFPSFATASVIGDALGELIPTSKIKSDPTQSDIFPYAISPSGGRIPLLASDVAIADNTAQVGTTQQQAETIANQRGKKAKKGAG